MKFLFYFLVSSELWQERERQTLYKIASTLLSVRVCDSVSTCYVDDEDVPLCVHAYMMHVCMGVCMYEQICTVYACVCFQDSTLVLHC